MSAVSAPPAAAAPAAAPAWSTPAFWSMLTVHVAGGVATVFALEGRDISHVEALVPVIALVASTIAHQVYVHRRGRNAVEDVSKRVERLTAELERLKPAVSTIAAAVDPVLKMADPKAAARLDKVVDDVREVEAATEAGAPPASGPTA